MIAIKNKMGTTLFYVAHLNHRVSGDHSLIIQVFGLQKINFLKRR